MMGCHSFDATPDPIAREKLQQRGNDALRFGGLGRNQSYKFICEFTFCLFIREYFTNIMNKSSLLTKTP